jgi:hypothetical protein
MPASAQFLRSYERDFETHEPSVPVSHFTPAAAPIVSHKPEEIAPRIAAAAAETIDAVAKPQAARPHFSHTPAHAHNHKPSRKSVHKPSQSPSRVTRGSARTNGGSRHGSQVRWAHGTNKTANGNGHSKQNGSHASNGNGLHKAKPAAARGLRNSHAANAKSAAKSSARPVSRHAAASRPGTRNDARTDARSRRKPAHKPAHKPALTASAKAGNRTRYGLTAPGRQRSKKRG